jgi:CRP-like cAMP-binding protein
LEKTSQTALDDARRLLGEGPLFRNLDPSARGALTQRVRVRHFAAGETIFHMGSPGQSMMAVLSGKVRISIPSPDGKEIVLARLVRGQVFGEIAVLDGKERTADAKAVEASEIAVLERRDVLPVLRESVESCLGVIELLCDRLRHADEQIADVALLPVSVRIAKMLLRLAEADRRPAPGRVGVLIPLSQRELGNMVGATRESVNKCFKSWRNENLVRVDEANVILLDEAALREMAELG